MNIPRYLSRAFAPLLCNSKPQLNSFQNIQLKTVSQFSSSAKFIEYVFPTSTQPDGSTVPVSDNTTDVVNPETSAEATSIKIQKDQAFHVAISNLPRLSSRRDIVQFCKGASVTASDVRRRYTPQGVPQEWYVRVHTEENFKTIMKLDGHFVGTRQAKIAHSNNQQWFKAGYPVPGAGKYRSVVVSGIPEEATLMDLKRLFRDYRTADCRFEMYYTRNTWYSELDGTKAPLVQRIDSNMNLVQVHKRAVVRFISEEEARRAARNAHNDVLYNRRVCVTYV